MNQNVLGVDLENYYDKKEYSLKTMGASRYVRDARFNPYLISVSNGTDSWAGHPRDFNWSTLEGATLVSHNAGFDSRGYAEMVRRGVFPKVNFKEWLCTANLSVYLCMRRDLLRATEFLLGVSVDKSYREDADGKTWEDMVAAGVSEKVKEAGRSDALRCWQIWTKYGHLWPQMERELSQMTIDQCQRGCAMDTEELQKQILLTQSALIQADARLPWIAEGRAPTSPKAIAEKCREHGIPSPPVKKHEGEEAYDAWEATYSPRFPWVKAYSDHRVLNKHLSTLETIKERIYDGNIFPYELLYFGAHTGRWAGSGGFNMQNMRKNPLLLDLSGSLVTDPVQLKEVADAPATPSFVSSALDVRKLFVARAGYRLMAPDLSQIEPRVLAWLVKDQKMLDSMAAGNSPYQAHAISTMNWTGGDLKKENKGLYALAKARVLGLGFQCGWNKFITVAQVMAGLDITKDDPEWTEALNDEGEVCLDAEGKPIMV